MKSVMRIISRYLVSAAGVALTLLAVNFVVFFVYLFQMNSIEQVDYPVSQIAADLTIQNGAYQLSDTTEKIIEGNYQWAMLLDDAGKVIWSLNLPAEIPQKFTVPEVGQFFPLVSG